MEKIAIFRDIFFLLKLGCFLTVSLSIKIQVEPKLGVDLYIRKSLIYQI